MAILAFQKPDKVVMLEANERFGKFEFRPLEPGFGVTIGNALRHKCHNCYDTAGPETDIRIVPVLAEQDIIIEMSKVGRKAPQLISARCLDYLRVHICLRSLDRYFMLSVSIFTISLRSSSL